MNKLIGNLFVWSRLCKTNWQSSMKQNWLAGAPHNTLHHGPFLPCLEENMVTHIHSLEINPVRHF